MNSLQSHNEFQNVPPSYAQEANVWGNAEPAALRPASPQPAAQPSAAANKGFGLFKRNGAAQPAQAAKLAKPMQPSKLAKVSQPAVPETLLAPAAGKGATSKLLEATSRERAAKFLAKWTSATGLLKATGLGLLTAFAGVGVYFVVNSLIHVAQVGISAKVAGILIPVAAAVAGTAILLVVGRALYRSVKKVHQQAEASANEEKIKRSQQIELNKYQPAA